MKAHRIERVSEVIREVASETILFELNDPRVRGVTVTRAEVSRDLQHAKVYVSLMGSEKEQELCMHGLRHAAGFVQRKLGSRLKTRYTPMVTFIVDKGVKNSIEMTRLINEALAQSTPPTPPSQGGEDLLSPPLEGGVGEVAQADGTAEEFEDQGSNKEDPKKRGQAPLPNGPKGASHNGA